MRQPASCDRARQWTSLGVDGELSELERAMLLRHLQGCEECATFAADVQSFHRLLSAAQLEPLERPIELPRRRERRLRSPVHVLAPAAAAIVALGVALGAWQVRSPKTAPQDQEVPPPAVAAVHAPAIRVAVLPGHAIADISLRPNTTAAFSDTTPPPKAE